MLTSLALLIQAADDTSMLTHRFEGHCGCFYLLLSAQEGVGGSVWAGGRVEQAG